MANTTQKHTPLILDVGPLHQKKMRQRQRLKTEGNDMDMTDNWEKSAENKEKPVYCRRRLDAGKD